MTPHVPIREQWTIIARTAAYDFHRLNDERGRVCFFSGLHDSAFTGL
jgi:hypothetical protein